MNTTKDERWDARVRAAMERLAITQRVLPEPDPMGRWEADAERQRFVMRNRRDVATVCADYAFLGTWSSASGSWLWAWANPSIPPKEAEIARRIRQLGVTEGLSVLTEPRIACSESEALEIAAVAWDVINAEAPYRFPMTATATGFMALFSIRTGAEAAKLEPTKA